MLSHLAVMMLAASVTATSGVDSAPDAHLACGAAGGDRAATAVLIGGIDDDWHSLESWAPLHVAAGQTVCGYAYDSRRQSMAAAAADLEQALGLLSASGTRRLFVTAFSMGGWIAKAALDGMVRSGAIHHFERVELVALGTPWGGFSWGNLPWHLRWFPTPMLARGLARILRRPMAFEVGSASAFVRGRGAPLPGHVRFVVCDGGEDRVAGPRTSGERANYAAVVGIATRHVSVTGATHDDLRLPRGELLSTGSDVRSPDGAAAMAEP